MMKQDNLFGKSLALVVILVLILGCGIGVPVSLSTTPTPALAEPQVEFPLPPDPVTIHVTLDESHAVSSQGWGEGVVTLPIMPSIDVNGAMINIQLPEMMTIEFEGESLDSAAGTTVTATPIQSVEGLPFSGGLLAGIQFSPEGLQMVGPVTVIFTLPGNFDPSQLVVFVARGSGEEFHLYPATEIIPPPPGSDTLSSTTTVIVYLMHFSLLGVARATAVEISSQLDHPPSLPMDQVEQLLASDIEDVLYHRSILLKFYDTEIKPTFATAGCGAYTLIAKDFLMWYEMVKNRSSVEFFQPQITETVAELRLQLQVCLETTCYLCLGENEALNGPMLSYYSYYLVLSTIAGDVSASSIRNLWVPLVNKCAVQRGAPEPLPAVCDTCAVSPEEPTPVVGCPAPGQSPR